MFGVLAWITDVKLCGKELAIDIGEGHAMLALSAACFYDLNRVTSHDISEIVYNLSRSTPEFSSTMEVELMALWVLWIGLDAEKFNFHATAERDSVTDRIFALASDQYDSVSVDKRHDFSQFDIIFTVFSFPLIIKGKLRYQQQKLKGREKRE